MTTGQPVGGSEVQDERRTSFHDLLLVVEKICITKIPEACEVSCDQPVCDEIKEGGDSED